jgi:hypothetical protein
MENTVAYNDAIARLQTETHIATSTSGLGQTECGCRHELGDLVQSCNTDICIRLPVSHVAYPERHNVAAA